ncbi:hypothetical protein [Fodinicola feengrottensis]|uniref:hypothetical protein n=1 Tax=Fodinicola feengrottensis TaxID=435914 RepID=UPI0031DD3926
MSAQPVQRSNAQTLSIIAIVISVLCFLAGPIVGIILSLKARKKAAAFGEPARLPQIALIVSVVFVALHVIGIIFSVISSLLAVQGVGH